MDKLCLNCLLGSSTAAGATSRSAVLEVSCLSQGLALKSICGHTQLAPLDPGMGKARPESIRCSWNLSCFWRYLHIFFDQDLVESFMFSVYYRSMREP